MKYLKWLLLLPVAAFPYVYFAGIQFDLPVSPWSLIWAGWLAGLAGAVPVVLTRKRWTARELALADLLIKLVHIPAYVVWFVLGVAMILFLGPLIAFVMDAMAILLSGLVGLAAVLRCRAEGRLTRKAAVIHGVLQFIFCADVFSAVWVYRKSKEVIST